MIRTLLGAVATAKRCGYGIIGKPSWFSSTGHNFVLGDSQLWDRETCVTQANYPFRDWSQ